MIGLLKALQLWAAAVLVGGPAFLALVWRPAVQATAQDRSSPLRTIGPDRLVRPLAVLAAVILVLGSTVDLLQLATRFSRAGWLDSTTLAVVWDLITETSVGKLFALRAVLAAALLALRPWPPFGAARGIPQAAVALSLLATFSLTGHSAAESRFGPIAADLIHMAATAAWYGGLCAFALLPWRRLVAPDGLMLLSRATDRFATLGLTAMALLAGTGFAMAAARLYGLLALVEHSYGRTLLIKLAFLSGVLLLAAVNHFWVRRRLAQPAGRKPAGLLRWLVTGEALLGLAVLVYAGILTTTPPPVGEPVRVRVTLSEYRFVPEVLEVPVNQPVLLTAVNQGSMLHSYVIKGFPHEMVDGGHDHGENQDMHLFAPAGGSESVTFIARQPGEYFVYCMVGGHHQEGMVGTLIVR